MKDLAIIGSGIAGLASAWLLRERYAITLYEREDYFGGHTNTVCVREGNKELPIDTGFMVYNTHTYPNLIRLFDRLGLEGVPTDMSFGVRHEALQLEMACSGLSTFFAQRRRFFEPAHWRLLGEIRRFFEQSTRWLEQEADVSYTLKNYLADHAHGQRFSEAFLLPMIAAIWSTAPDDMLDFPAHSLFAFMRNHGLLGIGTQFTWLTLPGGSRTYRDTILKALPGPKHCNRPIRSIRANEASATLTDSEGNQLEHELAIVATHADEALALLEQPTDTQRKLLSPFRYTANQVRLHSDRSVMPKARAAWASWNFCLERSGEGETVARTHYWMNRLQAVSEERDYFVSLNSEEVVDEAQTHWKRTYHHPRFDTAALRAQADLPKLNREGSLRFCGSYFGYGFHEDALRSSLEVVSGLTGQEDPLS